MKDNNKFEVSDLLLRQSLSSTAKPDATLNEKIIRQVKEQEEEIMSMVKRKKMLTVLIAVIIVVLTSTTAFAAWCILDSKQVAQELGDKKLAQAFDSEEAITLNETITSGGYKFTLVGVVSGKNLSDFGGSDAEINPKKTYAVLAIAREDGKSMPKTSDAEYGQVPFFVSPLIKGARPWQYNIASMGGGYFDIVRDGIMYRLSECDDVEIFADRGLYLCASTTAFYDINAYNYDEKTGEITPNPNFDGANALFDLPLNPKKADKEKADKYLQELWDDTGDSEGENDVDENVEPDMTENFTLEEQSIQPVTE